MVVGRGACWRARGCRSGRGRGGRRRRGREGDAAFGQVDDAGARETRQHRIARGLGFLTRGEVAHRHLQRRQAIQQRGRGQHFQCLQRGRDGLGLVLLRHGQRFQHHGVARRGGGGAAVAASGERRQFDGRQRRGGRAGVAAQPLEQRGAVEAPMAQQLAPGQRAGLRQAGHAGGRQPQQQRGLVQREHFGQWRRLGLCSRGRQGQGQEQQGHRQQGGQASSGMHALVHGFT